MKIFAPVKLVSALIRKVKFLMRLVALAGVIGGVASKVLKSRKRN